MKRIILFLILFMITSYGQVERSTTITSALDVMQIVRDSSYSSAYTGAEIDSAVHKSLVDTIITDNNVLAVVSDSLTIRPKKDGVNGIYINPQRINSYRSTSHGYSFENSLQSWFGAAGFRNFLSDSLLISNAGSYYKAFDTNVDLISAHGFEGEFGRAVAQLNQITFDTDTEMYNSNDAVYYTNYNKVNYKQVYQPNRIWTVVANLNQIDIQTGSDTVYTSQGIVGNSCILNLNSGVKMKSDVIGFRSEISTTFSSVVLDNYKAYHFYGKNNHPSWFGGSVNSGYGYNYYSDAAITDDYVLVLSGGHTLVTGLEVTFKANTANTGAATLKVNSLTTKNLTKATSAGVNVALATGDIKAGQIVKAVYDGTQFQVISRLAQ